MTVTGIRVAVVGAAALLRYIVPASSFSVGQKQKLCAAVRGVADGVHREMRGRLPDTMGWCSLRSRPRSAAGWWRCALRGHDGGRGALPVSPWRRPTARPG